MKNLRYAEAALKPVMLGVCAYEVVAIARSYHGDTHPPMVSDIMHNHKWAIPLLLGVLTAHFWYLGEQ